MDVTSLALAFAVVVALALIWQLRAVRQATAESASRAQEAERVAAATADRLRADLTAAQTEVPRLAKFSEVADASEEATRLLDQARVEVQRLTVAATQLHAAAAESAKGVIESAEREADDIRQTARTKAAADTATSDARVRDAEARAAALIAKPSLRASALLLVPCSR